MKKCKKKNVSITYDFKLVFQNIYVRQIKYHFHDEVDPPDSLKNQTS